MGVSSRPRTPRPICVFGCSTSASSSPAFSPKGSRKRVAERLQAGSLRFVGDLESTVETVAVCGGSGSSFTGQALRSGADAYVTADVTYHRFFDVLDTDGRPRMALIDAGHYETEALTEGLLYDWLRRRFPTVEWRRTETRTSPMETFIPGE